MVSRHEQPVTRIAINRVPICDKSELQNVVIEERRAQCEYVALALTHLAHDEAWATGAGRLPVPSRSMNSIPLFAGGAEENHYWQVNYQKVIDGARAVLDHYRPIPIHPDWPMVYLERSR